MKVTRMNGKQSCESRAPPSWYVHPLVSADTTQAPIGSLILALALLNSP